MSDNSAFVKVLISLVMALMVGLGGCWVNGSTLGKSCYKKRSLLWCKLLVCGFYPIEWTTIHKNLWKRLQMALSHLFILIFVM